MKQPKKKYCVDTYDYGKKYVYATSVVSALRRIAFRIYGAGIWGDADFWEVTEIAQ